MESHEANTEKLPQRYLEDAAHRRRYDDALKKHLEIASILSYLILVLPAMLLWNMFQEKRSPTPAFWIGLAAALVGLALLQLAFRKGWIGGKHQLGWLLRHEVLLHQDHLMWRYQELRKRGVVDCVEVTIPYQRITEVEVWKDSQKHLQFLVVYGPAQVHQYANCTRTAEYLHAPDSTQQPIATEEEGISIIPLLFVENEKLKQAIGEMSGKPVKLMEKSIEQVKQDIMKTEQDKFMERERKRVYDKIKEQ